MVRALVAAAPELGTDVFIGGPFASWRRGGVPGRNQDVIWDERKIARSRFRAAPALRGGPAEKHGRPGECFAIRSCSVSLAPPGRRAAPGCTGPGATGPHRLRDP